MSETLSTNPLTNANKLKLGIFALNGYGGARSLVPERFVPSWDNVLAATRAADAAGFEAIVPYSRWASEMDDHRHTSATTYETLTWAAGVGAATRYSSVMSTVHVMHLHPVYAAKAVATLDHITGGRFALNVVCGWVPGDMALFGHKDIGNEGRYRYADEWTSILKALWTEEEKVDFSGEYLSLRGGYSSPKPVQQPYPPLMNAGGSDEGRQFVGKHCDLAFVRTQSFERMKAQVEAYRRFVKENYGRTVQIWAQAYVVQRESYAEAERYVEHYAVTHADKEHVDAVVALRNAGLTGVEAELYRRNLGAGPGGLPVIGTPGDIVKALVEISGVGIDGVLLNWVDPIEGVPRFAAEVLPLLEREGLREPFIAP